MLEEGLVLMGVGIGTVLSFLTLLVLSVHASAAVIRRIEARRAGKGAAKGKPAA